jgi:AAA+ ATPase superfamily predicted ATPase
MKAIFSPILSNHSLIGSLQLLTWLFLRPSAWHRYVTQIDPQLPPDFALASLQAHQWRNRQLQRLLILCFTAYPLWSSLIIGSVVWIATISIDATILAMSYGIALTFSGSIMGALTIGLPFAVIASLISGTVLGIWVGLNTQFHTDMFTLSVALFTLSLAGSLNNTLSSENKAHPLARQIGSIVIGTLLSLFTLLIISYLGTLIAKQLLVFLLPNIKNILILFDFAYGLLVTLFIALFFSLILKQQGLQWQKSLLWGSLFGIVSGVLTTIILHIESHNLMLIGLTLGTLVGIGASLLFAFPYLFVKTMASTWAGLITGIMISASVYLFIQALTDQHTTIWINISSNLLRDSDFFSRFLQSMDTQSLKWILWLTVLSFFGITWRWWQAILLYPFVSAWNLLVYRAEQRRTQAMQSLFSWHSVCWDEGQYLPLFGLEDYLILLSERYPKAGESAMAYVSTTQQRWASQAAQLELDARRLQNCQNLEEISQARKIATGEFKGLGSSFLQSLAHISQNVSAALKYTNPYHQRLMLKEVQERLNLLQRELTRSREKYAKRFLPIVVHWKTLISAFVSNDLSQYDGEIDNPYVIMLPLSAQERTFVGRTTISKYLEDFLRKPVCPPFLLYGQRRMGKTSLLKNLTRLLPNTIVPLFVDLQGIASFSSDEIKFLYALSRKIISSAQDSNLPDLPDLSLDTLNTEAFIGFMEWLDQIEKVLENKTLLLMLDEIEALDRAFIDKRLNESMILGFFRHLIQHRPRLKILLAGSHTLEEFKQWASYFINVQILHISYLEKSEAQELIEQPLKDFGLVYTPKASERILELTRCHPCLIQMLCSEIIMLKNEQPIENRKLAQIADIEQAIPSVLKGGTLFFETLKREQMNPSSLPLFQFLAGQGEGAIVSQAQLTQHFPEPLQSSLKNLLQRELIETVEGGYRIQVELIRRYFTDEYNGSGE